MSNERSDFGGIAEKIFIMSLDCYDKQSTLTVTVLGQNGSGQNGSGQNGLVRIMN